MHTPSGPRSSRSVAARLIGVLVVVGALVSLGTPVTAAAPLPGAPATRTSQSDSRAIRVPPAYFGIHDGSEQAYDRIPFGSLRLWDAGVTWQEVETSPGVYDWTKLDSLVSAAQAHGVEVTLVLAMTPSFYGPAASLPPTRLSHFRAYVRAVMTRYRDFNGRRGIAAYQVWNEANVPTFWTGTAGQLATLTRIVHDVRGQVDPDATVVAPSFAMRLKGQTRWFAKFQAQHVGGKPIWHFYDANSLSLYPMATYGERVGGPEDAMALLSSARHLLARAGVPADLPVWASEINYGLVSGAPGQSPATPIPVRGQVANVIRTYLLGAANGLARMFWYRYDWGRLSPDVGGGTLGNTLLATPGSPDQVTPAGQALATVKGWLRGRLVGVDGQAPCAKNAQGTYQCVVRYSAGVRRIYWNPQRAVRVPIATDATYVHTSLGRVREVGSSSAIRVGYEPVMVESAH